MNKVFGFINNILRRVLLGARVFAMCYPWLAAVLLCSVVIYIAPSMVLGCVVFCAVYIAVATGAAALARRLP